MRFFLIDERFRELPDWPAALPERGFLWASMTRPAFEAGLSQVQAQLQGLAGGALVDLHISDLLNPQLPSQYGYTSWYDLLVLRRLAVVPGDGGQTLAGLDTSPVGFAVFDRLLLTVHPPDCSVRDFFQARLGQMGAGEARAEGRPEGRSMATRMPPSSADLMVRIANHLVDGYLDLRRLLTHQADALQQELLRSRRPFSQWQTLLELRNTLHQLQDICEDQRSAVQEWIDALVDWPTPAEALGAHEREVLRVRSRDVLEHIERVLSHVRRLEAASESAVQMHFSLQGQRTNNIMRTLTVLTAIFLPLNLITGIFGMNFDGLPLIHTPLGFWIACAVMLAVLLALVLYFRRRRYLDA